MALKPGSVVRATLGLASLLGSEVEALLTNGSSTPTAAATDEPAPDAVAPSTDWLHLGWGALAVGGERAVRTVALARRPIGAVTDFGSWVLEAPPLAPAAERMRATVTTLVERGRDEDRTSREAAGTLAERVVWRVVDSAMIDRIVIDVLHRAIGPALDDIQHRPEEIVALVQMIVAEVIGPVLDQALPVALDKIAGQPELLVPVLESVVNDALEPLLREVLPQVFAVLGDDPEAVRELVRGQSTGVAAEMAGTVRIQAVRADDHVDRIVGRVLRRRRAPAVENPVVENPRALPPGDS